MIYDNNSPIGFFDSGLGGLSVLTEVKKLLPFERYIYYADNLNSPYGNYDDDKIISLSEKGISYLLTKNIKALVVACNTVTAAGIRHIRDMADIPVIGMEPAFKPASNYTAAKKVLVLATEATLRQKKYSEYIQNGVTVAECPCRDLAYYIENNYFDDEKLYVYIEKLLSPYNEWGYDSLVLGCTHYVLKKNIFSKICGENIKIFDGNGGAAANLLRILQKNNMLCSRMQPHVKLILTKGDREIYGLYKKIMRENII